MSTAFKYEEVKQTLDGTITVKVAVTDTDFPGVQTFLTIEFADGSTVNQIDNKIAVYSSIVASLARSG